MLPIALRKSLGREGWGVVGEGVMWACLFTGSDTMVVWAVVDIGVANWTWVRLCGRLDGLCGESGILFLSMVGIAGGGLMVVTVHIFSNSLRWRVSGAI